MTLVAIGCIAYLFLGWVGSGVQTIICGLTDADNAPQNQWNMLNPLTVVLGAVAIGWYTVAWIRK